MPSKPVRQSLFICSIFVTGPSLLLPARGSRMDLSTGPLISTLASPLGTGCCFTREPPVVAFHGRFVRLDSLLICVELLCCGPLLLARQRITSLGTYSPPTIDFSHTYSKILNALIVLAVRPLSCVQSVSTRAYFEVVSISHAPLHPDGLFF